MPATEQTLRDQKRLHVVFGISSVILILSTVWMFKADHDRQWKQYQSKARDINIQMSTWRQLEFETAQVLNAEEEAGAVLDAALITPPASELLDAFDAIASNPPLEIKGLAKGSVPGDPLVEPDFDYEAFLALVEQLSVQDGAEDGATSTDDLKEVRREVLATLAGVVKDFKDIEDRLLGELKFMRAGYDEARANVGLGVRDGVGADELAARQKLVDEEKEDIGRQEANYQAVSNSRIKLNRILGDIQTAEKDAQRELDAVLADKKRLQAAVSDLHSSFLDGGLPGKRWLELPVLDAFNSPLKIENKWSDDLEQNYNFSMVRRFDRCTTCHQMMEKSLPGEATEPGFVSERLVQIELPIPLVAETAEPAEGVGYEEHRQNLIADIYGLRLVPNGLMGDKVVAVSFVEPSKPAAQAQVATEDEEQLADPGEIAGAMLKSTGSVSPVSANSLQRHTRHGLEVGDVIVSVDGNVVETPDALARRLLKIRPDAYLEDELTFEPIVPTVTLTVKRGLSHPFVSHPRLDLYVGSLSPHKVSDFACTICHEGQGSATDFEWASHTPDDPLDRKQWIKNYGWFDNVHWIYPQHPKRFIESTCLKCHHDVTELEPSDRFPEAPAPKLMKGYNTIRKFGCYGCHEVNGFDGPNKRVGPDMRVEPNTFAAAQQILATTDGIPAEHVAALGAVVESPESDTVRENLYALLLRDKEVSDADGEETAVFSKDTHSRLTPLFKGSDTPGALRKPGPSLRYIGSKAEDAFLFDWIAKPSNFRPSSRMPQFFGLNDHIKREHEETGGDHPYDDPAERYEPIEILGIVAYLNNYSQSFDFLSWEDGVQPDVSRGKISFEERGCLACHSHKDFPDVEDFRAVDSIVQGPDLSYLSAKFGAIDASEEASLDSQQQVKWLYTWIREPTRYHKRTVMPNLFLDAHDVTTAEGEVTGRVDPALDIVAYLLSDETHNWSVADGNLTSDAISDAETANLDSLVVEHLQNAYFSSVAREYAQTGIPSDERSVKIAESELLNPSGENLTVDQKLLYIGRKSIAKFGCYGCHDIPGFEDAKPIGTGLADWGRKDPSKLAFEHMHEYLHGAHGHGDDHSHESHEDDSHEDADESLQGVRQNSYVNELPGFFEEAILGHNRTGFIYQKLREPRSFDYHTTTNKNYNARLRMPLFPFSTEDREAVITFVLGLVAEPPREKYMYRPSERDRAIQEGARIIEKYNCKGCHVFEAEKWSLAFGEGDFDLSSASDFYDFAEAHFPEADVSASLEKNKQSQRTAVIEGMPVLDDETALPQLFDAEFTPIKFPIFEDPISPSDVAFTPFQLWWPAVVDGVVMQAGQRLPELGPSQVVDRTPADGGDLARYLLPGVTAREKQFGNPQAKGGEAWAWVPPPLIGQGAKVQTDWLHDFLLNPYPIRPAVVLRMPKFNMSPAEATKIVNYFAAKDNVAYPYDYSKQEDVNIITEADDQYNATLVTQNLIESPIAGRRLEDAMKIITNQNFCVKCHIVGDFEPAGSNKAKAPDLALIYKRLRPEYLRRWIARPNSILPYTAMPVNIPIGKPVSQDLYHGSDREQIDALVDLLMNYDLYTSGNTSITSLVEEQKAAPSVEPETPTEAAAGAEE